jgi:capsular polysaccharide biosynthesis protein
MTSLPLLLKKWWKAILVATVLCMLFTYALVPRLPKRYDVSMDVVTSVPERAPSNEYEFDGYYAMQAVDLFSDTIAGWLKSPGFVAQVFDQAQVQRPSKQLRGLGRVFTVKKISGQLINVSFGTNSEKDAAKLAESTTRVLNNSVENFNKNGDKKIAFSAVVNNPLIAQADIDPVVSALVSGLIVLVLGFNFVIIADAFKEK